MAALYLPKSVAQKILTLILVFTSACDSSSTPEAIIATIPDDATLIESDGKNYTIFFVPPEDKIPLNVHFDMNVQVRNSFKQSLKYPIKLISVPIESSTGKRISPETSPLRPHATIPPSF